MSGIDIRIHGQDVLVRAHIAAIEALSAHADYEELLRWLSHLRRAPRRVFLVHGEEQASLAFQKRLKERFSWDSEIPTYLQTAEL